MRRAEVGGKNTENHVVRPLQCVKDKNEPGRRLSKEWEVRKFVPYLF